MKVMPKKRKFAEPLRSVQGVTLDGGVVRKIAVHVYSIRFQRKTRAVAATNQKLLPLFAD